MAKDKAAAREELRAARKALARNARGKKHEDASFRKANRRVVAAEKNIPWWRR